MGTRSGWTDTALSLGDQLCQAVGDTITLAAGELTADGTWAFRAGWMNDPGEAGRPSGISLAGALAGAARLVEGPEDGVPGAQASGRLAAAVGWPLPWGRLLAAILVTQADHPSVLHHVGFRHPSREAFEGELAAKRARGEEPRESAAPDHLRGYTQVRDGHGRVEYYLEDQFYPEGPCDVARHWDLVTARPVDFLKAVAGQLGMEPQIFPERADSPWGALWLADEGGQKLGVMARPIWWEVPPSR